MKVQIGSAVRQFRNDTVELADGQLRFNADNLQWLYTNTDEHGYPVTNWRLELLARCPRPVRMAAALILEMGHLLRMAACALSGHRFTEDDQCCDGGGGRVDGYCEDCGRSYHGWW